jgi:cytosine/adenosine deaminase-related metal-dependent hydrolase
MLIVAGDHVLTDPAAGTALADAAVLVDGRRIAALGTLPALRAAHPAAEVIGGAGRLVMPGLIDAHSHGRGLSPIQKGVPYDYLENAFLDWSSMVYLPNDLCAALSAVRHLRMGCTAIHHTGWNDEGPRAPEEAEKAVAAYRQAGIRLAYSPAVRNRNRFVPDEPGFLATLPDDLASFIRPTLTYDAERIEHDYFDLFEFLRERHDADGEGGADGMTRVLLAPSWAHGTTERFLTRVRDRAAELGGLPIHIHTLQTPHQRAYGIRAFGKSLLAFLDDLGLVAPNLTLGHAVWLSAADIALLAARGGGITHHASCNLHVRNGIAPVWHMLQEGVRVAMGIDDKSLNDDDDPFQELRLASVLHRVPGFDLGATPALPASAFLATATVNAATAIGFGARLGRLAPGQLADLLVLDTREMLDDPWTSPDLPIADLVVSRAKGSQVREVVVNGQVVVRDGRVTTLDEAALAQEIRGFVSRHRGAAADPVRAGQMRALRPYVHAWQAEILRHLDVTEPFYFLNGRR